MTVQREISSRFLEMLLGAVAVFMMFSVFFQVVCKGILSYFV